MLLKIVVADRGLSVAVVVADRRLSVAEVGSC